MMFVFVCEECAEANVAWRKHNGKNEEIDEFDTLGDAMEHVKEHPEHRVVIRATPIYR